MSQFVQISLSLVAPPSTFLVYTMGRAILFQLSFLLLKKWNVHLHCILLYLLYFHDLSP